MHFADPTGPSFTQPAKPPQQRMTTVRLPPSGDSTNPYRYLIGYAHHTGYGSAVIAAPALADTVDKIATLTARVNGLSHSTGAVILGATLIAGPHNNLVMHRVPVSDNQTYRYLVTGAHGNGFSTLVYETGRQPSTPHDMGVVIAELRRRHRLDDLAILTITPIAGPE
jgi:hypothetical protein